MRLKRGAQRFSYMVQSLQEIEFYYWYKHTFFSSSMSQFSACVCCSFRIHPHAGSRDSVRVPIRPPSGRTRTRCRQFSEELRDRRRRLREVSCDPKFCTAWKSRAAASEVVPDQNFSIGLHLMRVRAVYSPVCHGGATWVWQRRSHWDVIDPSQGTRAEIWTQSVTGEPHNTL